MSESKRKTGGIRRFKLPFSRLEIPVNEWGYRQLLKALDAFTEVFEEEVPLPSHFRVSVWGTKRALPEDELYSQVFLMCEHFARNNIDVVTGGGPGVMRAANAGAQAGCEGDGNGNGKSKSRSYGLRVRLTDEPPNEYIDRVIDHRTFYTRLHNFVWMSSAFLVFEPGVGTLLEMLLVWQLLKEHHIRDAPLILVGKSWDGLLDWMDRGMAKNDRPRSKELKTLFRVDTAKDAIPIIVAARDYFNEQKKARVTRERSAGRE